MYVLPSGFRRDAADAGLLVTAVTELHLTHQTKVRSNQTGM